MFPIACVIEEQFYLKSLSGLLVDNRLNPIITDQCMCSIRRGVHNLCNPRPNCFTQPAALAHTVSLYWMGLGELHVYVTRCIIYCTILDIQPRTGWDSQHIWINGE